MSNKKKPARKKKDLTLRDVEGVKDDLQNHLKEIKRLFRRNRSEAKEDQIELMSDSDESSDAEEDRNMNRRIANLKKMLGHHTKMLKGEDDEAAADYGIEDFAPLEEGDGKGDGLEQTEEETAYTKKKAREEENDRVKQELRDNLQEHEGEYLDDLNNKMQDQEEELEQKRNRVLEMQVDDAFNRGKDF